MKIQDKAREIHDILTGFSWGPKMVNLTINNLYLGTFALSTAVALVERLSEMFPGIIAMFEKSLDTEEGR